MRGIKFLKFAANICAILVPVLGLAFWIFGHFQCWSISEIGTMIGATSGPLAGLAGFLYVYVNFLLQQSQFERQSFESGLTRLIDKYLSISSELFPVNPDEGIHPILKNFKSRYNSAFNFKETLESISNIELPASLNDEKPTPESVDKLYHEIFEPKFRANNNLMQSFLTVLKFLENGVVEKKDNYYALIYSQMKKEEYRILFYGMFCKEFKIEAIEKELLTNFFLRFDARHLLLEEDLDLLKNESSSK